MQIIPRIYYNGNCRQAVEHYHNALGASINYIMNFGSLGAGSPEQQDLIMNAQIDFNGQKFQLADRVPFDVFAGDQIMFLIVVDNAEEVKKGLLRAQRGRKGADGTCRNVLFSLPLRACRSVRRQLVGKLPEGLTSFLKFPRGDCP